jgi:hypothetical protein
MGQRATTEVQAANGALAHCKHPPIASLTEKRAAATACRTRFADTRDALLREYPFNFSTGWVTPAMHLVPSRGPLKNRFPLPEDCLGVRFVQDLATDEWAVEASTNDPAEPPLLAGMLVTNTAAPLICYSRRIENVTLWDALFLQVFELMLGARIAPLITRNTSLAESLEARALAMLRPTKRADAQEKARTEIPRDTSWLAARRGWGLR